MNRYPILQSGFISLTEEGLETPTVLNTPFSEVLLSKDSRVSLNRNFFSPAVCALFNNWRHNKDRLKEFEFRESIIKVAMKSFATPSIYRWCVMQNEKPTVTDLHKAFLIETLDYLATNTLERPRPIQVIQWLNLLESSSKVASVEVNVDRYFDKTTSNIYNNVYNNQNTEDLKLPASLQELIIRWVSKPRGFEDLLITLYVIFGDRKQRSDVSEAD